MKEYKKILIIVICYFSYASIYIARLNLSMASPALKEIGVLNSTQLGLLGSAFSLIFASGRLLNGMLSDRVKPWKMITIGLTVTGINNVVIGFLPPFIAILLLWSSNAFAQSMLWSSILCSISAIFDKEKTKRVSSLMVTVVAVGNVLGILLNMYLINSHGLRWAFIVPGLITLIFAPMAVLLLFHIPAPAAGSEEKGKGYFSLLRNRELCLATIPASIHGVMKENVTLWMTVYFTEYFGINLNESSYFILFIPIIGFVGRILYPVSYRMCHQREHRVSQFAFGGCILAAIVLCMNQSYPFLAMLCLSVVYAAISLINTSFLAIYPLEFSDGNVASVSGIMDFFTYLGGSIASILYGVMIEKMGYFPMFFSWIIISVLAIVILSKLNKRA